MFYGVFHHVCFNNLKNIENIVKIGGGGYVVKTYPSIDPVVPPPPLNNIHISVRLIPSRAVT